MLPSKQIILRVILLLSVVLVTTTEEIHIPSTLKSDETLYKQDENENLKLEIPSDLHKEIKIDNNINTYHTCLGCPLDLNVDAQGVSTLIDTALNHLESERDEKHVLIKVHRLQQQVVAGIKYILLVEVAPTVCTRNNLLSSCPIDQNKNSILCQIEYLEKPWVNLSKTIIKNNCTISQEFKPIQEVPVPRKDEKSHITDDFLADLESQIMPEAISAESQKQTNLVNDIVDPVENQPRFFVFENNDSSNRIPEFVPPQTYINSGHTNVEQNVETTYYEDNIKSHLPEEQQEEEVVTQNNVLGTDYLFENNDNKNSGRSKRNIAKTDPSHPVVNDLYGGWSSSGNGNLEVKQYLNDGLLHLDSQSPHTHRYKIQEILDSSSQIVAGKLWRIKAKVILSDCEKSYKGTLTGCGELQGASSIICSFKIWDQPWLPHGRTTNITCDNDDKMYSFRSDENQQVSVRNKRGLVGGIKNEPTDHPDVKKYLNEGLLHLDSETSHSNRYKIKEILEAKSQVVAGSLWRIRAKIILSDCDKSQKGPSEECGELEGATSVTCNFKIWDQPWLPQGRVTNITCDDDEKLHSFRSKRDLQDLEKNDFTSTEIVEELFNFYKKQFNKNYINPLEHNFRLMAFKNNLKMIDNLNKYEQGTATYGLTRFADMTREEFSRTRGLRPDLRNDDNEIPFSSAVIPDIELPTGFDWRQKNAVTKVKDQGSCGSCWAFSVTGNVEGQAAIKYGKLQEFSEQELVDCDKLDEGCNGGLMDNAYRTLEKMGGLESETDYPYDAEDEKCHFDKSKVRVKLSGALNISQDETDMAKWLVKNGPISIAINANAMQFYVGGVSHPFKFLCNPKSLDHGVLIVGYGVHTYPKFNKTLPYWIVKNSWGESWGEQGYYRVYRGDGTCGVNQTPSSAIVA